MSEPEDEFAALMARVRRDDNQALATLIALYEPEIRRVAKFLLGRALRSSLDPTDLVQSVHLQLMLGLKQQKFAIASPEQLRSLAATLLRHKFIQHWRRHRCQTRHQTNLALGGSPAGTRAAMTLRELDPAQAAEYNDLVDHLYRYLGVEDRRLVVMRLQGYRTGEIAAELGIEPAVLRVRLSRLRKRLREEKPPAEWL
jgi:RNA polymerase sigma-70 factor (ECF subfamily)